MKIYVLKIGDKIIKVKAEDIDQLSEKLFVLCPTGEFNLLAINFPNLRIRR